MKCTKRTWLGRPLTVVIAFLPLAVKFEPECTTDSLVEPERPAVCSRRRAKCGKA
jgi:hypothetical protein